MANIGKWGNVGASATLLTTQLNSLSNNTMSTSGTVVNNGTNLDMFCDLRLFLPALSPGTGSYMNVYILPSFDGSTYPSAAAALRLQPSMVMATFQLDTSASTPQTVYARNVVIPPVSFSTCLDNQSGVTLSAAGNTLHLITYDYNLNG